MIGSVGLLGAFYLATTRGASKLPPPADAIEQAMGVIMVLFLTPLSFNYGYVWLIFPMTVLLHLGFSSAPDSRLRLVSWGSIAASVVLLSLSVPMLRQAQAYGNVFASGLVLMLALGVILRTGLLGEASGVREPALTSVAKSRESVATG